MNHFIHDFSEMGTTANNSNISGNLLFANICCIQTICINDRIV